VFSIRIEGFEPQALSDVLENRYGILTRSGIHCAPWAHENFGTRAIGGTTRLSFGPFNTREEVLYAGDALSQICQEHVAGAR
jgi:selenocysteine lyase/cysteine desulfurase